MFYTDINKWLDNLINGEKTNLQCRTANNSQRYSILKEKKHNFSLLKYGLYLVTSIQSLQNGKWRWITLKGRNLTNITSARWSRSISMVINHVDSIFSWYMAKWHFASVILLPKYHKPRLIMRITSKNSNRVSSYKITDH